MANSKHNHQLHKRGIRLMEENKIKEALSVFRTVTSQQQPPSLDFACLKFRMYLCVKHIKAEYNGRDVDEDDKALLRTLEDPVTCLRQSWNLLRHVALTKPDPLPKLRKDLEDFPVFDKDDDDDDDDECDEKDGTGTGRLGMSLPGRRNKREAAVGGLAVWGLKKRGSRKETRDLLQGNILLNMLATEMEDTGIDPTAPDDGRPAPIPEPKILDAIAMDPGIPLLNLEVAYADFKKLLKEERTIHAGEAFDPASKFMDAVQCSESEGSSTPPSSSPSPSSTPLSPISDLPLYILQTPSAQLACPVGSPQGIVGSPLSPVASGRPKRMIYPKYTVHGPGIGRGRGPSQIEEEWW